MSMYREIVTKAVIGKGKVGQEKELVLQPEKKVDKVLGCWIINNHYVSVFENGKIYIDGAYDVNLWYAYDDERKTALFEQNIKYKEEVPVTMKKEEQVREDSEIKSTCVKYPTCTNLKLEDNKNVIATVIKEFKVDIIGETKLKVQVSSFNDEEWLLEEEIEKNINPNYMKK